MMSPSEMEAIVASCTYKPGWTIALGNDSRPYIQLSVSEESDASLDSARRDGTRTPWKSGKRYLSPHMCRQEIVGAVFDLIKGAEMHETHEWFRYREASIYNPHLDPDVLAEVARRASSFVTRENAMTMSEEPQKKAVHARNSPGPIHCDILRHYQGQPTGVICGRCGLGACPFFNEDGSSKL